MLGEEVELSARHSYCFILGIIFILYGDTSVVLQFVL